MNDDKYKVKVTQFMSKIKNNVLKHRFLYLILSVIVGILFAKFLYQPLYEFIINDCETSSVNSLLIALIALPTTAILWFFRTHDTRENIHQNDLFDALKMLTDDMVVRREIATKRLIDLAEKVPEYKEEIKLAFIKVLKSFPRQKDDDKTKSYHGYMLDYFKEECKLTDDNICTLLNINDPQRFIGKSQKFKHREK
jgi:hypothetical protein